MGIDMSEEKATAARAAGHRMFVADARRIDLPDGSVRFCKLMDFLARQPDLDAAAAVVASAMRLATDFVFIAPPNFDNEAPLRQKKLKRYYADWSGHSLHLRTAQLDEILSATGHAAQVFRYGEIFDTWDRSVIRLSAPRNSSFYDSGLSTLGPSRSCPARNSISGLWPYWSSARTCRSTRS